MRKKGNLFIVGNWILIYIMAMIIGTVLACFYTYESNRYISELLLDDIAYYEENGEFTPKTFYYRNSAFIYTPDCRMIEHHFESDTEINFDRHAEALIHRVQQEGHVYKILLDPELDSWFGLLLAAEMDDGNIYFMIRSLRSLQMILIVLFCSLTVFLLLSCLYSILIIRNSQRTEALRREYVANVSHDLKSPIASIRALSESLCDGVITDSEKQKKCYGLIRREAMRLESTVMNMLELSRTQSMQTSFEKSAVAPDELFLPIVEKYSERCEEMGIHFSALIGAERLPTLLTNAERVSVLTNMLLDNAVKFASRGGHISLEAVPGHKCVIVCVRDDGPGIEKEEQKRIFERFYTGSSARNINGSGLGLAIAAEICRGLNENIWVESSPGKGAAFCFTVAAKN